MKVKCYSIYENEKELLSEYANPSQKQFLDYELKGVVSTLKKTMKIQFQNTANGVWYMRQSPNNQNLFQIMLISKEASSVATAANFFNKAIQLQSENDVYKHRERLRMKVSELIKFFNANKKLDAISSNMVELQDIMKGNVSKMVSNMSQLDTAERKSSAMAELSIQFQRDAKELEKKMKRRKLWLKILAVGIISLILGIVIYILFL